MQWVPQNEQQPQHADEEALPGERSKSVEEVSEEALDSIAKTLPQLIEGMKRELALKDEMIKKLRERNGEILWNPVCQPSTEASTGDGDERGEDIDSFLDEIAEQRKQPPIPPNPPLYPPGSVIQGRHGGAVFAECTVQSITPVPKTTTYLYSVRWSPQHGGGISTHVPESELRAIPTVPKSHTRPPASKFQMPNFETFEK
eukprot:TRINITY_DN20325_c1_g1_i1.p1 TRINITY_DN20325_c1_g1~~TRINITY_DN20325_c1_g1_i1.p1  ORF type:complete len:201 (+),score=43.11 TRINITY_DN20325_c1_g1_i1:39-641(+)